MLVGMDYRYYYETLGTARSRRQGSLLALSVAAIVGAFAITGYRVVPAAHVSPTLLVAAAKAVDPVRTWFHRSVMTVTKLRLTT